MLHAAARQALFCPVYCLMPDHIHLLWMGLRIDSDQRKAMKFLREYLAPRLSPARFQHQPHDHVLREPQRKRRVFEKVCFYILDNARSADLISDARKWPFCGAILPGYPRMHPTDEDFWRLFWNLYTTMKMPNAGMIIRPALPPHP